MIGFRGWSIINLTLYEDMIESWLRTDEVYTNLIKPMLKYLVNGKMKKFEEGFRCIVRKTFSSGDTGKNNTGNYYHDFAIGILLN